MAVWAAELVVWLLGVGTLISAAVLPLSKLVSLDSTSYDEQYVWQRRMTTKDKSDKQG